MPQLRMTCTPTYSFVFIGISAVAAGYEHTCAVGSKGSVWCWGENIVGQLGIGSAASANSTFARIVKAGSFFLFSMLILERLLLNTIV